ncbi:hypothetical protein SDC9_69126 [bioreactor metagenome]|uniref:Uncharacterized protein n=1 Tax=bioreactor metagenome TaxID=1076179 RepID=A0A644Y429_9ZZZZ
MDKIFFCAGFQDSRYFSVSCCIRNIRIGVQLCRIRHRVLVEEGVKTQSLIVLQPLVHGRIVGMDGGSPEACLFQTGYDGREIVSGRQKLRIRRCDVCGERFHRKARQSLKFDIGGPAAIALGQQLATIACVHQSSCERNGISLQIQAHQLKRVRKTFIHDIDDIRFRQSYRSICIDFVSQLLIGCFQHIDFFLRIVRRQLHWRSRKVV